MYGSSPVMPASPFFRTSAAATPNNFVARAATVATSEKHGRGLMSLSLAGCNHISSDGVKTFLAAPLVKACLLQLDISRCPRITRAALMLPPSSNLCVLRASGCNNLHEVIMQLPMASPLTELSLNDCKALTRLVVVAPALQALHVGGCRHLTRLHVKCPRLTQLTASLCFRLSELQQDQWDCPALQRLNLFGCRHLGQPSLDMVLRASPALRHVDVNGCNMLVSLDLAGGDIQSVEVSGCKSLMALRCASTQLSQLTARACPKLTDLALDSNQLVKVDLSYCSMLMRVSFPALQALLLAQEQANAAAAGLTAPLVPVAGGGVMVSQAGCERLPLQLSAALKRLRGAARAAAAAAAAAQRQAQQAAATALAVPTN